jgi:signal transduction histidine kinase
MLLEGSFLSIDDKQHLAQSARDESNKIALIEHLRQAIGEKDRFLASVSHELRTPLNGIIGLSDTLLQVSPDDDLELADCMHYVIFILIGS